MKSPGMSIDHAGALVSVRTVQAHRLTYHRERRRFIPLRPHNPAIMAIEAINIDTPQPAFDAPSSVGGPDGGGGGGGGGVSPVWMSSV